MVAVVSWLRFTWLLLEQTHQSSDGSSRINVEVTKTSSLPIFRELQPNELWGTLSCSKKVIQNTLVTQQRTSSGGKWKILDWPCQAPDHFTFRREDWKEETCWNKLRVRISICSPNNQVVYHPRCHVLSSLTHLDVNITKWKLEFWSDLLLFIFWS